MKNQKKFLLVSFFLLAATLIAIRILKCEAPVFSVESGFYEEGFELCLTAAGWGKRIFYTLDGTEPSQNSLEYESHIIVADKSEEDNKYANIAEISTCSNYLPEYQVNKAVIVKACSINWLGQKSKIITKIYFVGCVDEGYNQVMVMSMLVEPDDLFSEETGIYVRGNVFRQAEMDGVLDGYNMYTMPANYRERGKEWERKSNVVLFDQDKDIIAMQDVGIRIHGGWTRSFCQKSFNFYSREEYGEDAYGFSKLMLRTSGFRDTFKTMLRDVFNQELVSDRDIATQKAVPCVLFINGEYWGLYNLQERFTDMYFLEKYGIRTGNVICQKNGGIRIGEEGDIAFYNELEKFASENDLSEEKNYCAIAQMMDIQSYIDYIIFECYIANIDWPLNNLMAFRSRTVIKNSPFEDGRWRWGAYDTDDSCNTLMGTTDSNPFSIDTHWYGTPLQLNLMQGLLKNDGFRKQFALSLMDMANVNFKYEDVHEKLYEMASVYAVPMVNTQHRFDSMEYSEETFWNYIKEIDDFYRERKDYMVRYTADVLGISQQTSQIELSVNMDNAAEFIINTTSIAGTTEPWKGGYYSEYPIEVTIQPHKGYEFVRWEGIPSFSGANVDIFNKTICVPMNQDVQLKAVIRKR